MKKQIAINKLAFNKAAVTELNSNQLEVIYGGTIIVNPTIVVDAIVYVVNAINVIDETIGKSKNHTL